MKSIREAFIRTLIVSLLLLAEGFVTDATACDYYASHNGSGNGLSQSSPFRIANFWSVAGPGKTLCLLDGIYTDRINPPENLNGTSSSRITIKALNDGQVRINGQKAQSPISLKYNDYFVIEAINVHNSGEKYAPVRIQAGADNNIIRRICAWDGPINENGVVFGLNNNTGNLLEDVCGFGMGRKIVGVQSTHNVTIRRAFGIWTGSNRSDTKQTFTIAYNSFNGLCENCIATWNQEWTPNGETRGLFSADHMSSVSDKCTNSKYIGGIGYMPSSYKGSYTAGMRWPSGIDCMTYENMVIYHQKTIRTAVLNRCDAKCFLKNSTEIGGEPASISSGWTISNRCNAMTVGGCPSIWNGAGSNGARVCKRYVNGTLTNIPLWPWPMNQRIIDAMRAADTTPVDVTRTMEAIFGAIPSECRSDSLSSSSSSSTTTIPTSPSNLQAF